MNEPAKRAPLDLLNFASMEEYQFFVALANNREELELVSRIQGLYNAALTNASGTETDFIIFQLLTFTHYHFLFSTSCQMRCHLSEAFASARVAIHAALVAAQIIHDRESQAAYVNREKPFDNLARYLGQLIKAGKTLPHRLVPILREQHKKFSRFASHADFDSFVHRIQRSTVGAQVTMRVEYFQFAQNDIERKIHSLALFHTFAMVLDVFSEFLVIEKKVVTENWRQELRRLGESLERRNDELKKSRVSAGSQ